MVRELSAEKRERFYSAALNLFAANGVQNTSTAEIAREAGTAAGTLFLYFPTKQDLVDALLMKFAKEQSENTRARLEPSLSARETFWAIWDSSVRWFLEHTEAYRFVQQVRDSSLVSERVVQESARTLDYFYDAIQKGLEAGAIRSYPAELIGGFLYQDIIAITNYLHTLPDPTEREAAIKTGFEIFWNGIKA